MVRKLAAILSADVVGYSRLMGEDEEATIHTVTAYREVIAALVQQHRGRVVDSPGDNVLAEFASVTEAVQCAVAIQRELNTRNTAFPHQRRMQFRVGINLGDVIPDGDRIYGDGVNIAARLEGLAEAGGICISGTVYDQVATKLPLAYEFVGERLVKNILKPVRVYRVRTQAGSPWRTWRPWGRLGRIRRPKLAVILVGLCILGGAAASWWGFVPPILHLAGVHLQKTAALPLPDKPTIAVLPFVNMSGNAEQEYFSDGMTEDLITDLAKLAGLFVIARNSVFTYKGKAVKPDQVSQELRVRYVLEGSVRKANDRVRITAQLIDATTGYHLWAERYDRDVQDIFAVQAEIARRITRALAVRLTPEESARMGQKYTSSVEAWDLFQQGMAHYRKYTQVDNAQARRFFQEAIALDRSFGEAYAALSATHRLDWNFGWTPPAPAESERLAFQWAQDAVKHDPLSPSGHQQLAYLHVYQDDLPNALLEAQEAVSRGGPNYANGRATLAQMLIYDGRAREALEEMRIALDLNPKKTPAFYYYHLGMAYYVLGLQEGDRTHFETARTHLETALTKSPNFRPARNYLVAVLSELGMVAEAQAEMDKLLAMGRPQGVEQIRRVAPYKDPNIRNRLLTAWHNAGG
jgi:TolB-like protein/class 3 adenylate cyclase